MNLSWNHRSARFPIPIARLSDATSEFSFFYLGALTRAPHFASGILTAVELPFGSLRVNHSGTVPATIGDTTNGSLIGLFLLPLSQCLGGDMLVTQKLWSASETAKADSEGQWFLMIDALSSCMALTEHDLPLKYFANPTNERCPTPSGSCGCCSNPRQFCTSQNPKHFQLSTWLC